MTDKKCVGGAAYRMEMCKAGACQVLTRCQAVGAGGGLLGAASPGGRDNF